jgi:hypothetical protein
VYRGSYRATCGRGHRFIVIDHQNIRSSTVHRTCNSESQLAPRRVPRFPRRRANAGRVGVQRTDSDKKRDGSRWRGPRCDRSTCRNRKFLGLDLTPCCALLRRALARCVEVPHRAPHRHPTSPCFCRDCVVCITRSNGSAEHRGRERPRPSYVVGCESAIAWSWRVLKVALAEPSSARAWLAAVIGRRLSGGAAAARSSLAAWPYLP